MKRIAFSCEDNQGLQSDMSMHFGRCPHFTLVDVEGDEIKEVQVVANPAFENHVPGVVPKFISEQKATVRVLPTDSSWFGITYPQDREAVVTSIRKLIDEGVYPESLWG